MHEPTGDTPTTVTWLVDLEVDATVELPAGEAVARGTFLEWLWATADGLVGVDEGAVDVGEAATLGIVASPLVIDVAAAPADRDWVGSLATARIACAFESEAAARAATPLLTGLRGCRMVALRTAAAEDETAWRDAFGPIEVAGFGTVRPAWEPGTAGVDPAGTTIFIEPGIGFGTGLHETTRLCLAALAAWRHDGRPCGRVLDFGSGSGILGIAAAVLGARDVDALEIDATVHEAIRANAARNGIADRVRVAAELPIAGPGYDLVLANIVAPVLIEHAAVLGAAVRRRPDGGLAGGLVLSGLRGDEVKRVVDRYRVVLDIAPLHATLGDWHCLRFG
jgi:ribosomal protein L11 methyltransferase